MTASFWAALALAAGIAAGEESIAMQDVIVRPGDTLWGIANTYLKHPENWDQILKYNQKLSGDPTVALPGMILKVPVKLIKEDLIAAELVKIINKVLFRRKETADWKAASDKMKLFKNDTVRTLEESRARVTLLNRDLLNLDPDSMAIIKPANKDHDVEMKGAGVLVGRSRLVTPTARVSPKTQDTRYSAEVKPDLTTVVRVHKGLAAVEAEGKTVEVAANMGTVVKRGMSPGEPVAFDRLPDFDARPAEFDDARRETHAQIAMAPGTSPGGGDARVPKAGRGGVTDAVNLQLDLDSLRVGMPVSGYHIQFSKNREFTELVVDKIYESDEKIDLRRDGLKAGRYWGRIAMIDLLGAQGQYSAPKVYTWGGAAGVRSAGSPESVSLLRPAADETVKVKSYRVMGRAKEDGVRISVNGEPVRTDDSGNFSVGITLKDGVNEVRVTATGASGESSSIVRRVTYSP